MPATNFFVRSRVLPPSVAPNPGLSCVGAGNDLIERERCGCSSVVEHELPKLGVEGSIPFTRSTLFRTYSDKNACPRSIRRGVYITYGYMTFGHLVFMYTNVTFLMWRSRILLLGQQLRRREILPPPFAKQPRPLTGPTARSIGFPPP